MTTENLNLGRLVIRNVRIAFAPGIFTAASTEGGNPRYNAKFIVPLDHPQLKEIEATMKKVASAKWGAKAADMYRAIEKRDGLALHDGDTKPNWDGFPGALFISAASKASVRPTTVDRRGSPVTESDGIIYSGCFVNLHAEFWAQQAAKGYSERINCQLRGVQFVRDGESFGGGSAAKAEEFESLEDPGGDDFDDDDAPF